MKTTEVMVVRIYLSEKEGQLEILLRRLHDWEKVRGVTVFRGISGFGGSGEMHSATSVGLVAESAGGGGVFRCAGQGEQHPRTYPYFHHAGAYHPLDGLY